MKKIIALVVLAGLVPSLALAAGNHPMAGCGLGYILLGSKENDKVMQVLGATTNGTFGNQTFGISSGTSGCTQDGAVKIVRATEVYVDVNFDSLRLEMASGQGEYVDTLASLLGATETTRPQMVRFFQAEYQTLFPTSDTTSAQMLETLTERLSQHPELLG